MPHPPKKNRLPKGNQNFDDRAKQLQNNVYNSDKGKLRLAVLQRDLQELITQSPVPLRILDAGCGSGMMSDWALSHGHCVTLCDISEVMLDAARKKLAKHKQASFALTTIEALATDKPYDVVFCHAVLEWVEEQDTMLQQLATLVKPSGYLSLMFYNAWARELAQLVYGNFDYVDNLYQVRQRVKLSPHRPLFPDYIEAQLSALGLSIQQRSGIRIFYDIMRLRQNQHCCSTDIAKHELRISQHYPYWQLGRYVHFLATKQFSDID